MEMREKTPLKPVTSPVQIRPLPFKMVVTDYNVAVEAVKWLLPALTVIAQAGLAAYFLLLIFYRKGYNYLHSKLSKWFLPMAFAVALAATSGSLFYSEIV